MKNRVCNYAILSLLTIVLVIVVVFLSYHASRNDPAEDKNAVSYDRTDRNPAGYWASREKSSPEVKTQYGELYMDLMEKKIRFQRAQVDKYCRQQPKTTSKIYEGVIIVSKKDKAGLCPAPKAACTTQSILMVRAVLGTIPDSYVTGAIDYGVLKREAAKLSLKSVPEMERPTVLRDYFLLFMFRNPFDRLLSSYRSKLPSLSLKTRAYLKDREWIVSHYHPKAYNDWLKANKSYSVDISFSDFVEYLTTQNRLTDGHFMPLVSLCQPCEANYTYYGNFKTFGEDIGVLMDKIHAPKKELKVKYGGSLSSRIAEHYGQLNETQKVRVINRLSPDLKLFYLIFPSEKKDDEEMLGMKLDEYVNL